MILTTLLRCAARGAVTFSLLGSCSVSERSLSVSFPSRSFVGFSRPGRAKPPELFTACTSRCTAAGRTPCAVHCRVWLFLLPLPRILRVAQSGAAKPLGYCPRVEKIDRYNFRTTAANSARLQNYAESVHFFLFVSFKIVSILQQLSFRRRCRLESVGCIAATSPRCHVFVAQSSVH